MGIVIDDVHVENGLLHKRLPDVLAEKVGETMVRRV